MTLSASTITPEARLRKRSSAPIISGAMGAFTLIEVLAVIAMLSIIVVLLFPVSGRIVERARLTGCLGSLRQLAVPANAYQMDHHGFLPPRGASTSTFKSYLQYFRPYLPGDELFLCPKARLLPEKPVSVGAAKHPWYFSKTDYGSYALNYALCPENSAFMFKAPIMSLSDFAPRSEIPMFIDATWPGFSAEASEWQSGRIPFERHEGASVLFVDGSVAFYAEETVRNLKWNRNYLTAPTIDTPSP